MARLFLNIYDYFNTHKKIFWGVFFALFILVAVGALGIRFENDINKMIPHDPKVEAMNNILSHTQTAEQLVFTMQFVDSSKIEPDNLIAAQDSFEQVLKTFNPKYISQINSIQDAEKEQEFANLAIQYLPLFLNHDDYIKIDSICATDNLKTHFEQLHNLLLSPAGMVMKDYVAHDPLSLMPLAMSKLQAINFDPNYELYNGYIFNKKLNKLTFFVKPTYNSGETGKNKKFIEAIDKAIEKFKQKNPEISIQYFGGTAVAVANAVQMQKDTILTLSMTIVLLLALTYYVFKRKRISLIIIVPVIFGALFGLSITALMQDKVSIIAIGAGAIILGIAVDFSVHFMSYTREAKNIRSTVKHLSMPLTLGAITTVLAFWALRYANTPLLQDLGTFASFSLMGASLFTLIFLPHISPQPKQEFKPTIIDKVAKLKPEGNKWLLVLVLIATPILFYFSKNVQFDGDLMKLNYMSPQLHKASDELNKDNAFALSSMFVITNGQNPDEASQKMEQQQKLLQSLIENGAVKKAINPTSILPSLATQQAKIKAWQDFWTLEKKNNILQKIKRDGQSARFSADAFSGFETLLNQEFTPFDSSSNAFLKAMLPSSFAQNQNEYFTIATLKVAPGKRSELLTTLNQENNIIVTDRQSVSEKLLDLLQNDFNKLLYISGAIVFLALLIAYGRIELALISFLPMLVSWIWITGFMSILGLHFNVVNIVIATLLFGLGDDYSIFMMDSLMEKYRTGKSQIESARSAVYLSVLTTIIGLGTLIFAKHPALQSIALITIVGLLCVVFIAQVLQPFLFNAFIQKRADKGFMPFTILSFIKSVFSFSYFVFACFLVSILGFFLIKLNLLGKRRSKFVFHFIASKMAGSVIYINHKWNQKIIKDPKINFDKPAVYIANHSSFLDILLMVMMHPKLVLLTNKWVYRSPIFGAIVRMAEYYPVADGAEESIEPLRSLVERGYNIVVFPEGTRSKTDKIARFHKGAFYIADQLQLDLVPIIMHGAHYTMQKGDFLLKNRSIHVEALEPISFSDHTWGDTVKDRTKAISKHFRKEYKYVKSVIETPKYFSEQLIMGNIYKGPVLEWYCRVKTCLEDNYEYLQPILPREGKFYDLGCGYGFMTYLLHWASESRKFIGVDYDEDKIVTANHHYKKTENINFEAADLNDYELQSCNGIIISDVLHYLLPEKQMALLEKCYNALQEGGLLILRDGVKELQDRHKGTERSEKWSTEIIGFNKTKNELHFIYQKDIENWAASKQMSFKTLDYSRKTSNILMILQK